MNQKYILYLHLPIPLEIARVLEFVKSQREKPKLKHEGYLYCLLREKKWIKNVEMRHETVQSHCNNVRRQRFHNKRALALARYEAFGATEGFRKDERKSRKFQRAAKKNCPR